MLKGIAALMTMAIFICGSAVLGMFGVTSTGHLIEKLMAGYLLAWGLYVFLSGLPRHEIQARFVLMTLAGVIILGAAEIPGMLGLVNYQVLLGTPGRDWWDRPGYIPDTELVYRHVPHYREQGKFVRGNIGEALCLPPNTPEAFDLRYDQNGFRNEEDMDRAEVVVIGDSYVESPMLPTSALLTTALRESLGSSVANLGISGYGPEQELIVLKRYALTLQPKTIVWMFFEGNDLLQLNPEVDESDTMLPKIRASYDDYWMRSLTRNLLVLSRKVTETCVPHRTFLQFRGTFQGADGKQAELFFWEKPTLLKPTDRLRLERLRSILTEAHELCREQGIRFIVAFAPVSYRVHQGLANFQPSTAEMQAWPLNDMPDIVEPILREISSDIEFLDLTRPLREAAATGVLTYLPDDTHWTADGQRVAGEALHQHVTGTRSRPMPRTPVLGSELSTARRGSLHRF